jgi:pimeloyl-ACP methyl ester carboxylesterase
MIVLLLITALLSHETARADWNPRFVSMVKNWNEQPAAFPDRLVATAWGAVKDNVRSEIPEDEQTKYGKLIQVSGYQKKLPITLKPLTSGPNEITKTAPLLVILPGIFGPRASKISAGYYQKFERDHHMLVVPNPWSIEAASKLPTRPPGDIRSEASQTLEIIRYAVQSLGEGKVTRVEILGVSYGAFLSVVTASLSDRLGGPRIDQITVISPPLLGGDSALRLDQMTLMESGGGTKCGFKEQLSTSLDLATASKQADLSDKSVACARLLVLVEFQNDLKALIKVLRKQFPGLGSVVFNDQLFTQYLNAFPDLDITLQDEGPGALRYWVREVEKRGPARFRILSARDDFLNDPRDWEAVRSELTHPDSEFLLLNWGGHVGFMGRGDFLVDSTPW